VVFVIPRSWRPVCGTPSLRGMRRAPPAWPARSVGESSPDADPEGIR
jgi:hypothetical protein